MKVKIEDALHWLKIELSQIEQIFLYISSATTLTKTTEEKKIKTQLVNQKNRDFQFENHLILFWLNVVIILRSTFEWQMTHSWSV